MVPRERVRGAGWARAEVVAAVGGALAPVSEAPAMAVPRAGQGPVPAPPGQAVERGTAPVGTVRAEGAVGRR